MGGHSDKRRSSNSQRVAELKKMIDNDDYLDGAIDRLANVLTNAILCIPQGGDNGERKWDVGKLKTAGT